MIKSLVALLVSFGMILFFGGCSVRQHTPCCNKGYTVKYPEPYYYESDCGKRVYVPSFYDSCGCCYDSCGYCY